MDLGEIMNIGDKKFNIICAASVAAVIAAVVLCVSVQKCAASEPQDGGTAIDPNLIPQTVISETQITAQQSVDGVYTYADGEGNGYSIVITGQSSGFTVAMTNGTGVITGAATYTGKDKATCTAAGCEFIFEFIGDGVLSLTCSPGEGSTLILPQNGIYARPSAQGQAPVSQETIPVSSADASSLPPEQTSASAAPDPSAAVTPEVTTTAAAPAAKQYDVNIKNTDQTKNTLSTLMSAEDYALMNSIFASGANTASESSSEAAHDINGLLCIVDSQMQAVKYEYYMPGEAERIILVCADDGKVYAGLVAGSEMRYYTNDPARKSDAPACISGYASAMGLTMKLMP